MPFRSVNVSLPSVSTVAFSTISRHSRSSNLSIRIPLSSSAFTSPSSNSLRESLAAFLALQAFQPCFAFSALLFVFRQFCVIEIFSLRMHRIFSDELLHCRRKPVQVDILRFDLLQRWCPCFRGLLGISKCSKQSLHWNWSSSRWSIGMILLWQIHRQADNVCYLRYRKITVNCTMGQRI